MSTSNNNLSIGNATNVSFEDDFLSYLNKILPLKTDEALLEFESKLVDNVFKSKVVNMILIYLYIIIYFLMFLLITIYLQKI